MDSGENSGMSIDEVTLPLSPVLCSGHSKKLLKNRIRNRKVFRKCKSALSYSLEYQNSSKSDCNVSAAEPQFQNPTDQETVADRIKRLEALENKRLQMINTISFSSLIPNDRQSNQTTDKTLARTNQMLLLEECTGSTLVENTKIQRNAVNISEFRHFQTGSGKQLAVSQPQIENSKKLFDDIFHSGVSRDNKYNYLHGHSAQTSVHNNKFFNVSAKEPAAQSRLDSLEPTNKEIIGNSQSPKNKITSTDSKSKDMFEDLSLENDVFQAASLQLETLLSSERLECSMPVLKKQIKHSKENFLQGTNKIFEGENVDDLSPSYPTGFQAASLILNTNCKDGLLNSEQRDDYMPTLERQIGNTTEKTCRGTKNILEGASVHLNTSCNQPHSENRDQSMPILKRQIENTVENTPDRRTSIFEGETFANLKPGCNEGFQKASLEFNARCKNKIFFSEKTESAEPALKQEIKNNTINTPQRTKNIFDGENFDDLKSGCNKRFQTASSEFNTRSKKQFFSTEKREDSGQIKNNKEKLPERTKNIFEAENFDDLQPGCNSGFQAASVHLKANCDQQLFPPKESFVSGLRQPASMTGDTLLRRKNIFEGENFDDLKPACSGFQATSLHFKQTLRPYEVSSENLTYSNKPKIFETSQPQPNHNSKCSENTAQSNSSITSKSHSFNKPESLATKESKGSGKQRNIFEGENFDDLNLGGIAFQTANTLRKPATNYQKADKSIAVQVEKSFKNIFEGKSFDDLNISDASFTTKIFKPTTRSSKYSGDFRSPLKTILEDTSEIEATNDLKGFPLLEQQHTLNISNKYSQMLEKINAHFQSTKSGAVKSLLSIQSIGKLAETINSNKEKLNWKAQTIISRKRKISEVDSHCNISDLNCSSSTWSASKRPKKRLGCFVSPSIQVQPSGIKMANHLFEDLEPKTFSTSTPVKFENLSKPLNCNSTPVPSARKKLDSIFSPTAYNTGLDLSKIIHKSLNPIMTVHSNKFSLSKPAEADARVWLGNLDKEKMLLEEQLRIVNEKQAILAQQATMLDLPRKVKPQPGLLYEAKRKTNRVRLQEYVQYSEPGAQASEDGVLDQINPQNSHLMHFISCQRISHVTTEDGAVIIPNVDSKIGISEIEHSFKLLEGVDTTLIPSSWIRNHYKWIIWKLASYERRFPHIFDGCLSVENVMQQLKYRYDVEIDRAQRSALRKIFEKDDCPQKRMVLCVSKVIKTNDMYELELTDGWYPIRTIIDVPLCDQIIKGKIKIGTKMIVCGAELMNCEGCHPLEATDSIHLKISFNSTRRALWWCKLGYQKQAGPFVIPLSSINMNGGKIGCLKCFILRVYPVKFLETCGSKKVWRNQKADERCEQNFYSKKFRRVDSLHNQSTNDVKSMSYNNVKNIYDPEILYDILQRSRDPENLQEMLTSTQNTILYNYSLDKSTSMHTTEWNDDKTSQRAVKALLKIKIVDACYNSDKIHDLQVWAPTENHLQELREGEIVTLFNTSCSSAWGLNASQNTQFKIEGRSSDKKFEKFMRKVTHVKDMETFLDNSLFNEFDTVGIVVKKTINEADQQVWMADREQRLLLINICDSPKNILVLDMINEGQIVSVCNLIFQHHLDTHSFAVGNHYVTFARYSKHKHLQQALDCLEKDFKEIDRHDFILSCTRKIKKIGFENVGRNPMDLDDMECSQITTTDIALLECLEKLA